MIFEKNDYLCSRKWEFSSVGSEHLPYKQGVAGSNPTIPTKQKAAHWQPFLVERLEVRGDHRLLGDQFTVLGQSLDEVNTRTQCF